MLTIKKKSEFNATTNRGEAVLNINFGSGRFTTTSKLTEQMGLKPGMYVQLAEDKASSPSTWYITDCKPSDDGWKLSDSRHKSLTFSSKLLSLEIKKSLGITDNARSIAFIVTRETRNEGGRIYFRMKHINTKTK